jgi:antitoxin (DNA-binding transcriptional repressor) of toxin-antitoxin stability system
MRSVNVSTLKAQLSAHLQLVRNGEELIVRDRNRPIARIVPCIAGDYTEQQQRLIAAGRLIPPKVKRSAADQTPWPDPPGKTISDEVMRQVWQEERDGR